MKQLLVGLVLKFVLAKVTREPAPAAAGRPRRSTRALAPAPARDADRVVRSRLLPVMLGSLALALPLMLIFENTFTRIAGVLLCFTFIVSGVFVIANPADLGREAA